MAYSTYLKYARALIDVVVERDIEDRIEQEVEAFQVLLADHELLRGTLETPALPFQPKRRIVEELASRLGLIEPARNFVLVPQRKGRKSHEFDQAVAALQEALDDRRRSVRGEVTSAQPVRTTPTSDKACGGQVFREMTLFFEPGTGIRAGRSAQRGHQTEDRVNGLRWLDPDCLAARW